MALDTTVPSLTLRRLGRSGTAALLHGFGGCDLTVAKDRVDARHFLLHLTEARVVVELTGDVLEAQVEQLLLRLGQLGQQLLVVHFTQLGGRGHQSDSPARVTNLALIGSFWMARSMASLAKGSGTPANSNMMRPGRTGATQRSGFPLPEPMRVSAGFSVTGLSGKSVIHTLPPRLTWRGIAIRAASIWRSRIHPRPRAW